MSSHGRRRQRSELGPRPAPEPVGRSPIGPAQLGWALLVIAAALIGGLAAATLVHTSITTAVIVSVVAGGIAILAAFRSPARQTEVRAGQPPQELRAIPPAGNQTVVQLLPLPPQPGNAEPPDTPWWDSARGAPPPSPDAKRASAPDLSTYLASTFIAQCPRCGAFRLDIRRGRNDWDFRCEACECTWTWQPGTPWPPVRVMPRGRPPAP